MTNYVTVITHADECHKGLFGQLAEVSELKLRYVGETRLFAVYNVLLIASLN